MNAMTLSPVLLVCLTSIVGHTIGHCEDAYEKKTRFALVNPSRLKTLSADKDLFVKEKKKIVSQAEALIKSGETFSVTSNNALDDPNRNNYFSMGPYWWPNPKTKTGLPYVRRDGKVNPERDKVSDTKALRPFLSAIETLAIAYAVTNDERYAKHAVALLRAWFLDAKTRMAPNMLNAQAIPGKSEGRGTGIIDTQNLAYLVDHLTMLKKSSHWTAEMETGINAWFEAFLKWLLTHPNGKHESNATNNHGTAFDKQAVAIALFLGKREWVKERLNTHTKTRIESQIKATGEQPLETRRTKSWNYTCENLHHFFLLGLMAKSVKVDLFNYVGKDGAGLRKALDYAVPYAYDPKEWPHKMIVDFQVDRLKHVTLIATIVYGDKAYDAAVRKHGWNTMSIRTYLRLPGNR